MIPDLMILYQEIIILIIIVIIEYIYIMINLVRN